MPESTTSPLLRLPRELRDQIYNHLFTLPFSNPGGRKLQHPLLLEVATHIPQHPLGLPSINRSSPPVPFSMLAPLCKSCKQLYWEATPFYLSNCILSVEDIATTNFLVGWLETFGTEGFKGVQHLDLTDFARYEEGIDHALLSCCPNLISLSLTFRNTNDIRVPNAPVDRSIPVHGSARRSHMLNVLMEADQNKDKLVAETLHLEQLFEFEKLENLTLTLTRQEEYGFGVACCHHNIEPVMGEKVTMTRQARFSLRRRFKQGWEERGKWVEVRRSVKRFRATINTSPGRTRTLKLQN